MEKEYKNNRTYQLIIMFTHKEWKTYFSKFSWYKPDAKVPNSTDILNEYQRKLFEYLTN